MCSLLIRVTWWLVSDVRRGTRGAARAGYDVAGLGLTPLGSFGPGRRGSVPVTVTGTASVALAPRQL